MVFLGFIICIIFIFIFFVEHQIHEVTKPENLFSKLNFSDGYELIDKNIFNISTSKIVDVDILDDPQKYDNCGRYIIYNVLEYI